MGIIALESLGFLVRAEGVVQFGDAALKLIHGQGPVLIEKLRHRPRYLRLPGNGRRCFGKGHAKRVLVIEPRRTNQIKSGLNYDKSLLSNAHFNREEITQN